MKTLKEKSIKKIPNIVVILTYIILYSIVSILFLFVSILFLLLCLGVYKSYKFNKSANSTTPTSTKIPLLTEKPTLYPTPTTYYIVPTTVSQNNKEYGVVKQINEYEYTQKLEIESYMATPSEIYTALNNFRNSYGKGTLSWDNDLASWASSRAQFYANIKNLDQHAGFTSEATNKFQQIGKFASFGENAFYGVRKSAIHIIEWSFASDDPHKNAILDDWNTIGVGTASNDGIYYGVDLIFGKR